MRRTSDLTAIAALGATAIASTANADLVWHTNPQNGHQYALTSPGSWEEAQAESELYGANLVEINDASENAWILNTFSSLTNSSQVWIGLTDRDTEGKWLTALGETPSYLNWSMNQPFDPEGNKDYATMYVNNTDFDWLGTWRNQPCGYQTPGIMELPETVPEPGALALAGLAGLVGLHKRRRRNSE